MSSFKFMPKEKQNSKYYYIDNDLKLYFDYWCYIIYSKRGPGKTFSILDLCRRSGIKFIYMKRTNGDIKKLCGGSGNVNETKKKFTIDLSPFKPINRVHNTNIRCFEIDEDIAGFFDVELDEEKNEYHPVGDPYGYALSVNSIAKYKGFNLDECDVLIYDEFIPMPWERVLKTEGTAILSLYDTLTRDRIERGLPEIKLIALANASDISNQLFDVLEIIDDVVMLEKQNKKYFTDKYKGIMVHHILPEEYPYTQERKTGIQRAMEGTQFAGVEYEGSFSFNNLSVVKKERINGYKPICSFKHRRKIFYVFRKNGSYYVTDIKHDMKQKFFDLSDEVQAVQFWNAYGFNLRVALFENRCTCSSYTAYNLIFNYKKYYKI